jgi:transposase, IS5 family
MIGSILLKQVYNQSDENFVERWIENPYWQYFCVEHTFQKQQQFEPSKFSHFRKRIGKEGQNFFCTIYPLICQRTQGR